MNKPILCAGNTLKIPRAYRHERHKTRAQLLQSVLHNVRQFCSLKPLFYGSHYLRNGMSSGRSVWAGCNFPRTKMKIFFSSQWNRVPFSGTSLQSCSGKPLLLLPTLLLLAPGKIPANSKSGIVARSIDTLDLGKFINSEVNYLDLRNWVEFISTY